MVKFDLLCYRSNMEYFNLIFCASKVENKKRKEKAFWLKKIKEAKRL